MQAYEYLASVNVESKRGLIQSVINSGKTKFMYYVYNYVPELMQEEKKELKESIIQSSCNQKYKAMLTDGASIENGEGKEWN